MTNQTSMKTKRIKYFIAEKLLKLALLIAPFGSIKNALTDAVWYFESDYKYETREIHK